MPQAPSAKALISEAAISLAKLLRLTKVFITRFLYAEIKPTSRGKFDCIITNLSLAPINPILFSADANRELGMKLVTLSTMVLLAGMSATSAFASDADDLAAGIKCKPAKDLIKVITKMTTMKPEKTDTVAAFPKMRLTPEEGRKLPDRLFIRSGSEETVLPIADDGRVTGLEALSGLDKSNLFCVEDKSLIGVEDGKKTMGLSMDFDISYKNKSGSHEIAELRDGLGDGRAHIKKLVPAPVRMMIPKFDHVLIEYLDENGETIAKDPQITALQGDVKIDGLVIERLKDMHFVNIDQLEELGADRLQIDGGPYKMDPSPSLEKTKKFMDGGEEDTEK